jgi:hypothetical protein
VIILNTDAAWQLRGWCLGGHCVARGGRDPEILKEMRKRLKRLGCPRCGRQWMSFEIRGRR